MPATRRAGGETSWHPPAAVSRLRKRPVRLGPDDVDLSTWDWSKFHRGFGFTLKRGPKWVRLEDDVRIIFHGDEEVNEALRKMMRERRSPAPDPEKRRSSRSKNRTQVPRPARSRRRS